jgi:hypothetical protein
VDRRGSGRAPGRSVESGQKPFGACHEKSGFVVGGGCSGRFGSGPNDTHGFAARVQNARTQEHDQTFRVALTEGIDVELRAV